MVSTSRKTVLGTRQNGGRNKEGKASTPKHSTMKVVVRVRPLNSQESTSCSGATTSIRVMDQNVLVFDPNEDCEAINFPGASRNRTRSICGRRARDLRFIFDRVFDGKAKNAELFEHTTKEIIDGVLDGYNCTVFAYGATGAGKTFTMLGNNGNPGVMFLTMMDLYRRIHEMKDEKTCDVAVSYLEVYNETIHDLLLPGPPLAVREDPQKGVCVSGLTLHKPRTAEELLSMLEFGNNNRTQHPTDANAQSSRSHAVFQVFVRQKDRTAGLQANVRLAKMSLIDLAGSERATVTTNRGARFREGANINKSLLALGNCINALADKENKSGHIPYRDSKLTRLLKDSLGGNCRTVMIAAISPSSLSFEETYNTLKYADRAKSIKVNLSRNVVSVDFHVSRYAKIVDELRTEITELKSKLSRYENGEELPRSRTPAAGPQGSEQIQSLTATLRSIMNEREIIKKDMVDIEAAQRDLMVKAFRKERNLERIRQLCVEGDTCDQAASKTLRCLSVTKTKKKKLETRILEAERKLQKNTECLDRAQDEIKALDEEGNDWLISCQSTLKAGLECTELRRQCRYFKKHAHAQEKDANNTERIVLKVLAVAKKQFLLLKGAGLATPEVTHDYDSVVNLMTGGHEVSWADQSKLTGEGEADSSNISNFISFDSVIDGTPVRPMVINESTTQKSTPQASKLLMTPRYFANQSSKNSPVLGKSLRKEFDAVTSPMSQPKRDVQNSYPSVTPVSNVLGHSAQFSDPRRTPSRGTPSNHKAASTTPLVDSNGEPVSKTRNPTPHSKVAWVDLPARGEDSSSAASGDRSPVSSGSGEPNISGVIPATLTPKANTGSSLNKLPAPFTPLRELPLNCKKVMEELHDAGLPSMYDTPNKKSKFSEKTFRKSAMNSASSSMMPKRNAAAKENAVSNNKPFRKATSTIDLQRFNQQKVQKHLSGLRKAMSSSAMTSSSQSRNFAPRTTKEPSSGHVRPRWQ